MVSGRVDAGRRQRKKVIAVVLALIAAGERNVRSGIDLGAAMADIGAAVSKLAEEA